MDDIITRRESLPGKHTSLWLDTAPETEFPPLQGDTTVDVAILGGGIAGLTTAFLLKIAGAKVAVFEGNRIIDDVTGHSTAKLTVAHGLIYKFLIDHFGKEKAQIYADANKTAIEQVVNWVGKLNIGCDLERMPAYTYAETDEDVQNIRAEVDAASKLGLPVTYVEHFDEPFQIKAAIRYEDQVRFHPKKYLLGLAKFITGEGCHIYEKTRATHIEEGNPCVITTDRGTIRAEKVVQTVHYPFFDPVAIFTKMMVKRSYVIGVRLNGKVPAGMFYCYTGKDNYRSLRPHPFNGEEILLVGGEQHKAGHDDDVIGRYQNLEKYARNTFDVKSIEYYWSTQDNTTVDRVPYIGQMSHKTDRIFVATGFKGWGMSQGTVAGMLLAEEVQGRSMVWTELYKPGRVKLVTSAKDFLSQNLDVAKDLISGYVGRVPHEDIDNLQRGEGKIVVIDGKKTAIYKDEFDNGYCMNPACTHLGCVTAWNNAEKTWDCPCHGSRFNYDGTVIHGPANRNLASLKCRAKERVGST